MSGVHLHIMARSPVLGHCKTRLARTIGDERALEIYQSFLKKSSLLAQAWPGPLTIHLAGTKIPPVFESFHIRPQPPLPLGGRIAATLTSSQLPGLVIGTDCPQLTLADLKALHGTGPDDHGAIGPAIDGGFWGLYVQKQALIPVACADDLPWSRSTLTRTIRKRCRHGGLNLRLGPTRRDVDTARDLTWIGETL